MNEKSMTARVSAYTRAYHVMNNQVHIFEDNMAKQLFTEEEFSQISKSMTEGINFFCPNFTGNAEEALRWIVDNQLSPTPLARAAFAEESLKRAVRIGARQYLIFGAGYDTFAYRQPDWAKGLEIYEIDHPATAEDKQMRLKMAKIDTKDNVHYVEVDLTNPGWKEQLGKADGFDTDKISFATMLGLLYYLPKEAFAQILSALGDLFPKGSTLVFDYPDGRYYSEEAGERVRRQTMLAAAANERMLAGYDYPELEKLLSDNHFLIYEHLTPDEMTEQYFAKYNRQNPSHPMNAFDNVNYCLAVRQ